MNDNQATTAAGAVYNNGYSAAFKNTVVWNGGCAKNGGGFTSGGHNDGPKGCGFTGPGDFFKKPQLGLLGQHGGFSATEVPAATSPLVDTGSYSGCPTVDERGVHRPQGPGCDIGAVERKKSD